MKTERIYMNASCVPEFHKGMVTYMTLQFGTKPMMVIHTSVSDSCITVRPLHWWERLLHWLKGLL
jgi:hypothetical protein